MKLNAGCHLSLEAIAPSPLTMMLRPRSGLSQWVSREEYQFEPTVPVVEYVDSYGNLCQRLLAPQGLFQEISTATTLHVASPSI